MPRQPFAILNLEDQLERLKEFETKLHNPEDLRMTKIHLNDFYWVTRNEKVRTRIEDIAKNHGDKQFIEMIEETKQKLLRKNRGRTIYTGNGPNWVSPYD